MSTTKKPKQNLFPDWWWRYDRYEVKDGYIRPVEGQKLLRYEPWTGYQTPHGKAAIQQPYESLFRLMTVLDVCEVEDSRNAAIVEWCSKYGLLGVLLHQSESVVMPITQDGKQRGLTEYYRETRGWSSTRDTDTNPARVGAMVRKLGHFQTELKTLDSWSRFFPGLTTPPKFPPPFSDEFWNDYAESVTDFMVAGYFLRDCIRLLASIRDSRTTLKEKQERFYLGPAETMIHALTANVRPMIYLESKTRYGLSWAGGSLLSNLAMMAVLDFTKNRLLFCGNPKCAALFVTNSIEGRFCSKKCRGTVQMRKYRNRIKKGQTK